MAPQQEPALPDLKVPIRRLSLKDFFRLIEVGILEEDEHVELIEGVMVAMAAQGHRHTLTVMELGHSLSGALPKGLRVLTQSTIPLAEGFAPEPDLAIVEMTEVRRTAGPWHPSLVIEVADTTLERDRHKVARYAGAGVPELWVVDLNGKSVEVYQEPNKRACSYRTIHVLVPGNVLRTRTLPSFKLSVTRLFQVHG